MSKCADCEFYSSVTSPPHGRCRRHAPTVTFDGETVFPITNAHSWCGDFKAKERSGFRQPSEIQLTDEDGGNV